MNKYDRTAQQGTEGMREGCSEGASLALQPYPHLPPGFLATLKELRLREEELAREALLIRVCRRKPRYPISFSALVLHLQKKRNKTKPSSSE